MIIKICHYLLVLGGLMVGSLLLFCTEKACEQAGVPLENKELMAPYATFGLFHAMRMFGIAQIGLSTSFAIIGPKPYMFGIMSIVFLALVAEEAYCLITMPDMGAPKAHLDGVFQALVSDAIFLSLAGVGFLLSSDAEETLKEKSEKKKTK